MSKTSFCLVTLAAATLAGCVAYQAKELNPAVTQMELERRTLRDEGLQRFLATHHAEAGEAWDLDRLTLAGFFFSPELAVARAQSAEAEAGVRTAQARPNPTLGVTPGYNQDATAGVTPWILEYALGFTVELAGKRGYRTAEAQHQAETARLEVARVAWVTRAAVRRALCDVHAAEATVALWRDQQPLLAQAARLVELQVKAGEVSSFEAAQARLALGRAELAARESDRAVTGARSRLAEAIGIPRAALDDVALSYRGLGVATAALEPVEARRWAAQNRADLLAALAVYAASQSALQGEIARQYPDLLVGPGYQLDQGEGKWALALGVTLPVLNQNQGPVAAAQGRREVAAAKFRALQNHVLAEVDRAAADFAAARADLAVARTLRANIEQQAKTIRAQQAAGETSRLELTRAQIDLAEHARVELEARLRVELALGVVEEAVQRPLAWPESAWRGAPRAAAK